MIPKVKIHFCVKITPHVYKFLDSHFELAYLILESQIAFWQPILDVSL